MTSRRPSWWGSRPHLLYTIVVFVVLASLDNAAVATIPPLIDVIADDLGVSTSTVGFLTATIFLVTAVSAVGWGYLGDRTDRKRLLFLGTMLWSSALVVSTAATGFAGLFAALFVMAMGLGSVASVGFSVVSDFVSPRRRGLAMSFWGLSQAAGSWLGLLVGGLTGSQDWRRPFLIVSTAGFAFALLYLTTYAAPRGRSEPALAARFDRGGDYPYRIEWSDLRSLVERRTNVWLIAQGFAAQFAYGSLIWVPLLYQAKVEALGYPRATAVTVGAILAALFQLGGLFSIAAGAIGDFWQARDLRGRAWVSMVGILGAVPFFVAFFFLPLRELDVPVDGSTVATVLAVLRSVFTNPWVGGALLLALIAGALTAADSPNKMALISDVNLPEHRGTVFGASDLASGVGRSLGNALTGVTAVALTSVLPEPWNYAAGLAIFQLFFLPTGYCYWRATRTVPRDVRDVRTVLLDRGRTRPEP